MEATKTQSTDTSLEPGIAEYELILMLNPTTEESERNEFADATLSRIEGDGSLLANDNWGVRKMAYEIDKHGESDYRYYRFRSAPPLLDDLNHTLKIADHVLRFRVFKVDPRTPTTAPPEISTLERDRDDRPERSGSRGGGGHSSYGGSSRRDSSPADTDSDDGAGEATAADEPVAVATPDADAE